MEYKELDDLKYIKKHYGEEMSHLCRELFPTVLERPGLLYHIISNTFHSYKRLYNDIINAKSKYSFKNYIYSLYDNSTIMEESAKSVKELLDEAGYDLYECTSNQELARFRKYYLSNEELCTFKDPHRLDSYHIFFIVKKNVDEILRQNFKNPKREDEYSTSVLDLQFDKGIYQRVSIKSRYNHTVHNPDSVYSNNLDNIVEGLTSAFEHDYNFNIGNNYKTNFYLSDYIEARDKRFYKYNYEIHNIHYCVDNIIINNGKIIDKYKDKSRYIVFDYFILDMKEKKVFLYDKDLKESFIDGFNNIKNIKIEKQDKYKNILITFEDDKKAIIKLDSDNKMIEYMNESITNIECWKRFNKSEPHFLKRNKYLKSISLPNVEGCGREFLHDNKVLSHLELPKLKYCGQDFLYNNESLSSLSLPNLIKCGDNFLYSNHIIEQLDLPNLVKTSNNFLYNNKNLTTLYLPKLEIVMPYFLNNNRYALKEINLPRVKEIKYKGFLYFNQSITKVNMDSLESCLDNFLYENKSLEEINLPNLISCKKNFLHSNEIISSVNLPKLEEIGPCFMYENTSLTKLSLPSVKEIDHHFLSENDKLDELYMPNLEICKDQFLISNNSLEKIDFPNLIECKNDFIPNNNVIKKASFPKLKSCMSSFLSCNNSLFTLFLPSLESCDSSFLNENNSIEYVCLPSLKSCKNSFLTDNEKIKYVFLPNLESCGQSFLESAKNITTLIIPSQITCDNQVLTLSNVEEIHKVENSLVLKK